MLDRVRDPQGRDARAGTRRRAGAVNGVAEHLLEYERIPLGPLLHQPGQLQVDLVAADDRGDHLADAFGAQWLQLDDVGEPRAPPILEGRQERVPAVELVRCGR